ncbi:MAG: c-type cytochrome, partial [Longimicrobiales bacterium]|nr:c-type cytochrome [Longimicrobiales bacterium]
MPCPRLRPPARALLLPALLALAAPLTPTPTSAQGIWPERGENLQVLPADASSDQLRAVMQGFTRALGVRCSYCHTGAEGQPLSQYDFVSDDNPNKERARLMYRMMADANRHLEGLEPSGPSALEVGCATCHAGKPRPLTLAEALAETAAAAGGEAAVERFLALRQTFYGGNQYDFRAPSVDAAAAQLLERGDTAAADRIFGLNTEHFPDFAPAHQRLGEAVAVARPGLAAAEPGMLQAAPAFAGLDKR